MDVDSFPDRTLVSLWMREYEAYLIATEDEVGIGSSETHGALQRAWALHRLVRGGVDYVLFHSASYGRYLALMEDGDEEGYPVQCTYDSMGQHNVLFRAVRAADGSDDIYLRHFEFGDWCRPDDEDTAMPGPWPVHWVVEAIPSRQFPPELPPPIPVIPPAEVRLTGRVCMGRRGGHYAGVQPPGVLWRRINYVWADDQGHFNRPPQWRVLYPFEGQSVFNLRRDLAAALAEANDDDIGEANDDDIGEANDDDIGDEDITLCVWGGSVGRWTPLVIDLPSDEETMYIVILTTGSPAAQELVYADVDAP